VIPGEAREADLEPVSIWAVLGVSPSGSLISRAATFTGELTTGSGNVLVEDLLARATSLRPTICGTFLARTVVLFIRLCSSSRILSIKIDFFFEPLIIIKQSEKKSISFRSLVHRYGSWILILYSSRDDPSFIEFFLEFDCRFILEIGSGE
jgi:hypothetical protein